VNPWGNGMLEQWNDDRNKTSVKRPKTKPNIPVFQLEFIL
jgi:hypothetical protein